MIYQSPEEFIQVKEDMFLDMAYFGETCLPQTFTNKTPDFHHEIYDAFHDELIKKLLIVAPRHHAKCQSGEHDVILANGQTRKLKDIQVGDKIQSIRPDNLKFEEDTITAKIHSGMKECIKVHTRSNHFVDITKDHLVLTFDGWKRGDELSVGDYVASPRRIKSEWHKNNVTSEEARLLAYLIAEGCLIKFKATFTNTDKVLVADARRCAESLGYNFNQSKCKSAQMTYNLSGGILDFTRKYGIQGHKSYTKRIPVEIFNSRKSIKWEFIAGMFDTDGWIATQAGQAGITLANLPLIEDMKLLLSQVGILSRIIERPNDKAGAWALLVDNEYLDRFAKLCPLRLKGDKLKALFDRPRFSKHDIYPNKIKKCYVNVEREFREEGIARVDNRYEITRPKIRRMLDYKKVREWDIYEKADVYWDKIDSISDIGEIDTYDVTVAKNESLITNWIVTHNSSVAGLVLPLHHIFYGEGNKVIVLVSKTQNHSIKLLGTIKDALETSAELKYYFGDYGESTATKWTEKEVILKDGTMIVALGTGQQIRGIKYHNQRPTLIIVDDPEDEENTKTKDSMNFNFKWILKAAEPALADDGRIVIIGTMIHEYCIVSRLRDAMGWKTFWYKATEDWKTTLWPDKWPVERLKQKLAEATDLGEAAVFYQEWQNEIIAPEEQPFKKEMFRYWDGECLLFDDRTYAILKIRDGPRTKFVPVNLFMGVDPASSLKKTADYTAIVVLGVSSDGTRYIIDYLRKRMLTMDVADTVIAWHKKYNPTGINVESTGYQEMLRDYLRKSGIVMPGIERENKPRGAKNQRLLSQQPRFYHGEFVFPKDCAELEEEYIFFNPEKKNNQDDLMDGVYYADKNSYVCYIEPYYDKLELPSTKKRKRPDWKSIPRAFSSGALSIWSKGVNSAPPDSARTFVIAAVNVVLP